MSEQLGSIIWTITAKADDLEKGLKSALDRVNVFKDKTESADKSTSTFEQTMGLLAQSFRSVDSEASSTSNQLQNLTQTILQSGKASEEQAEIIAKAYLDQQKTSEEATNAIEAHSEASEDGSTSSTRFAGALKDVEKQSQESTKGITNLKTAVNALIGGFLGLKVVRTIVDQFKQSIEKANEMNRVMTQTQSTIASTGMVAGVSAEQVKKMADEIQNNTAISTASAQAGMNMLLQYTRIGKDVFPEATQAMIDMATATNGGVIPSVSQLESTAKRLGSALNDPVKGTQRLTESGITFTDQQKKQIEVLVESGRVAEAQGIILDRLRVFQGSAEAQAGTYEGQIARFNNQLDNIRQQVGNSVLPALTHFVEGIEIGKGATNGLIWVIKGLSSAFVGIITLARSVGIVLSTVFASIASALQGDFRTAGNVIKGLFNDLITEGARAQETITNIWSDETSKQTGFAKQESEDQGLASGEKSKKIIRDLEKETEAYKKATEKRKIQFEKSLADLIWAHQDKVKELRSDIKTEEEDFAKSMAERTKKFTESMREMEEAHLKKVETLEKQLSREEQKQDDKVADVLKNGKDQLDEEEKLFKKREAILESQLENELAKGKYASQSVLETLRRRLDNERVIHGNKVDEIKQQIEDETQKAIDSNQERIEDLQDRLKEETENLKKEKESRELSYEEETTKLQQEHNVRVSNFRTSLDEELGILGLHKESVDKVKDQARLDDISRLKRQFEEQAREEDENHRQRMVDIRTKGADAGSSYGQFFNDGLKETIPQVQDTSKSIADTLARTTRTNSFSDGKTMGSLFMDGLKWSISNNKYSLRSYVEDTFKFAINPIWGLSSSIGNLFGSKGYPAFADGVENFSGGMALVGERGPEIVNLPRGSDVIPNEQIGNMGNATVNIGQVNERADIDMIIRELGFKSSIQ
jgi:hypothetical protein